jgi:hypothetical protein
MRGLAHYRLLRCLAQGGEGMTYLALDTRLSRRVVIKRLQVASAAERAQMLARARRVALLEGPRVVQVLDMVASGNDLALVLRYVPGCDLAQLLALRGSLSLPEALALGSDLAAALAAARQQLLVHGDLKAANVLLGQDGRAALTDFGIAVRGGQLAAGHSASALTPEHLLGVPLSQQSDFFALGLLLYRMIFGAHPFFRGGRLDRQRLLSGLDGLPPVPGPWSGEAESSLGALLERLLAPQADDRPRDTRALRQALQSLRSRLPAPPSLVAQVRQLAREETRESVALEPLPARLLRPPLWARLGDRIRSAWVAAAPGARAMSLGAVCAPAALGLAWVLQPGPCIALAPVRIDAPPALAARLPSPRAFEAQLVSQLRSRGGPMLIVGDVPGSDSRPVLRAQGMRDICVPQQRLRLDLRCHDGECDLQLLHDGAVTARRAQLRLAADSGWNAFRAALAQLLDTVRVFRR